MPKSEEKLDRKIGLVEFATGYDKMKGVKIKLIDDIDVPPLKKGGASRKAKGKYSADTNFGAHPDFIDAMQAIKTEALELFELNVIKSELADISVLAIKVDGDIHMNQARLTITLGKRIGRTESVVKIPVPPVTLSDEGDYLSWKRLKEKVLKIHAEAFEYIKGKHLDDSVALPIQMDLTFKETQEENNDASVGKKEQTEKKKKDDGNKPEMKIVTPLKEPVITGQAATA
jgi:hypothetical protein